MYRLRLFFLLLALCALPYPPILGQAPAPKADAKPDAEPLRTAGERPVDVRHIRLDLQVDLPKKAVDGVATLRFTSLRELRHLGLDAVGFKVNKVTLARGDGDGATARFGHDGKTLTVDFEPAWPAGQAGTLRVDYQVREPKEGLHFFGPTKDTPDAPLTVWSQGEPVSNRHWFPCLDQPDQRQSTEIVVTVPRDFVAVSNGKLVQRADYGDSRSTFHWLQSQPHPSYLVTLVVGQFDVVEEEWDGVPVSYYVPRGEKDKVGRTFGRTRAMLDFFSKRFGVRYPWEKYAQVVAYQFGGGMENTSATTLGDALVDERSALDGDADGLIAHELAHQWWGDLLTCRDWAHVWLNEGFASFAECLWDEQRFGADAYVYNLYRKSSGAISGGKARPVVDRHYSNPDSMFDARAYPKGAWVLHMLRRRLGDDAFWRAVRRYAEDNRLKSVETSDFRRVLERETGRDLGRFFYDWTERPGSPVVDVATEYLAGPRQARVVVKQTQAGEAFHFPLTLAFHVPGTEKPVVVEQEMTDKESTVLVPLPGRPSRVDVDTGYAVLAELNETKGRDLWEAQLKESPDVVGRIRAAKFFAKGKTDADRRALAASFAAEKFWGLRWELASALGEAGGDVSRDTLLGGLRDADARVRRACLNHLDKFKTDAKVIEAVRGVLKKGDPSYGVEGEALRQYAEQGHKDAVALLMPWLSKPSHRDSLRGSALRALGSTGDPAALDTLLEWARPGHPQEARTAAIDGLLRLARKAKLGDEPRKRLVSAATDALASDSLRIRFATLSAVNAPSGGVAELLPAVEKVSRDDPDGRVREFAKTVAEQLRKKDAPAAAPDVAKLREEVERLKKEQEALRERLNRFEKGEKKP